MTKKYFLVNQIAVQAKQENCPGCGQKHDHGISAQAMDIGHAQVGVWSYLEFVNTEMGSTESMWVRVTAPGVGVLDDTPQQTPNVQLGDVIEFEKFNIRGVMSLEETDCDDVYLLQQAEINDAREHILSTNKAAQVTEDGKFVVDGRELTIPETMNLAQQTGFAQEEPELPPFLQALLGGLSGARLLGSVTIPLGGPEATLPTETPPTDKSKLH